MSPDMAIVIPLLGAGSAFLFVLSSIPAKSPLTRTLEQLESRPAKPQENGKIDQFVQVVLPPESRGKLAQQLVEAGWYTVSPAQMVLRVFASALIALIVVLLFLRYVHLPLAVEMLAAFGLFCGIVYLPLSFMHRAIEHRKEETQKTLPDFLDMMSSTVQAGLSVNAALAYAVDVAPGSLGDEIKEALAEIRLGRARAESLKAAAERLNQTEFSTTIGAITQAERLGSNIGKILSELADDTRTHRVLIVEEHAAKLPVKMVFPMAFFLLPALFVIIFGSLVVNYLAHQG
ncbi:MAG TPA: type II secretion system F family protein [Candidatus Baltobacteraceae bacterium]|nr:type II secretion system F family protein [Candidatus Baltobacteraceae bacterium]